MTAPESDLDFAIKLPTLPKGWRYSTVAEVGATSEQTVLTGPFGTHLGRSDFVESGVPLLTISCLTDRGIKLDKALFVSAEKAEELERYRLREGDILFSRMASVGRAGIVGKQLDGALFNYHIMRLRLEPTRVEPKFFAAYVRGASQVREYLKAVNHGATRDGINTSQLMNMPIAVAPIFEQRDIIAEIDKQFSRLDEAVANLTRVKANLKRYKAAVLKAAVEGRLVPTEAELARREGRRYETGAQLLRRILETRRSQWNGKGTFKEPTAPDTTDIPQAPEGWAWATTEQFGQVQLGRQRSPKNRSKENPIKYIRAANITESGLELSDVLDMEFSLQEQERYRLRRGDLLLSEASGSPDQVGKPSVWREQLPQCCFQNTVIRLRPAIPIWEYLLVCFQSYYVGGIFAKIAGGVGINHLSAAKFSQIAVPLPPEVEQYRIVAEVDRRLSFVRGVETEVDANLKRAERLRQAVLARLFGQGMGCA